MSESLGFIHHWLYKKIRLLLDREIMLVRAINQEFDGLGDELHEILDSLYGAPLPSNHPLESLIDLNNIHGWLQKEVTTVEAREASLIKDCLDCCGDNAPTIVLDVFRNHGFQCGLHAQHLEVKELQSNGELITAPVIYNIMQNYYLNGMPCDGGDDVLKDKPSEYIWMDTHTQQRLVWARLNVNSTFMSNAYAVWIEEFINALDCNTELKIDNRVEPYTFTLHVCNINQ